MAWIYIGLIIVFLTVSKLLIRKTLQKVSAFSFAFVNEVSAALIFLPFAFTERHFDFGSLGWIEYAGLAASCLLWTFLAYLGNKTIQKTEMSVREPLSQFRTLFGFFIGLFLLHEATTVLQYVGVAIIFLASFLTVFRTGRAWYRSFHDEGILLVVASSFLFALVSAFDKINASVFPSLLYTFLVFGVPAVFLATQLPWKGSQLKEFNRRTLIIAIIASTLQCMSFYLMLKAYVLLPFTVVYPSIQLVTITAALAGMFFLNERTNIRERLIGAVLSVIGVILIRL